MTTSDEQFEELAKRFQTTVDCHPEHTRSVLELAKTDQLMRQFIWRFCGSKDPGERAFLMFVMGMRSAEAPTVEALRELVAVVEPLVAWAHAHGKDGAAVPALTTALTAAKRALG